MTIRESLIALLETAGHSPSCQFKGCTCGAAGKHRSAALDASKLLRDGKAIIQEEKKH